MNAQQPTNAISLTSSSLCCSNTVGDLVGPAEADADVDICDLCTVSVQVMKKMQAQQSTPSTQIRTVRDLKQELSNVACFQLTGSGYTGNANDAVCLNR
jgi:hypothetical protein